MSRDELEKNTKIVREGFINLSARHFVAFLSYTQRNYRCLWFHKIIAESCQRLFEGTLQTDRLMIFVPPQHGKSEIVSRKFPAWVLGREPGMKIVGTSYSAELVQQFSRSIQRMIDSEEYRRVFPDTRLSSASTEIDRRHRWIRNVDFFETVGQGGFYKAVGVLGGLTGTPVDLGIIDDPVKDALEAYSQTYRDRVWEWYTDVFLTRLHNRSKVVMIMTRWHEDDLAGRLLAREPEAWTVIRIPALREDMENGADPRQLGEALWEERHSRARLEEAERRSPRTFAALYQQRPTIEGGNIVRRDWFRRVSESEYRRIHGPEPIVFFVDTAYTDKKQNDPTGIIGACRIGNDVYITAAGKVNMKFPDLCRWIPRFVRENGYGERSTIRIEPKANGLSVIDQLREITGLNVTATPSPRDSKETRLNAVSPMIECGRLVLVGGAWTEEYVEEMCGFPTSLHDEYVDVTCYALDYFFGRQGREIDIERLARVVHR